MKIFDPDETTPPTFHVLDPESREARERELEALRAAHGKVQLDVHDLPWCELHEARELPPAAPPAEEGGAALVPVEGGALVPVPADRFESAADFLASTAPVIEAADDPRLMRSFGKLRDVLTSEAASRGGAADYLAAFLPDARAGAAAPGGLRRVLDALAAILGRFFGTASVASRSTWDVLKDPDAYYLRLRGEVAELARTRGGPLGEALQLVTFVPDLFRLYVRLLFDARVSSRTKSSVVLGLVYLLLPIDAIPEALLSALGYTDDVFALAVTLVRFLDEKQVHPGLVREHWSGTDAQLELILSLPRRLAGIPFFDRLLAWLRSRKPRP